MADKEAKQHASSHDNQIASSERDSMKLEKGSSNELQSHGTTQELSSLEIRALLHRVDRRLVLTAGFMYCVSLIDRTNLGAAMIAGMSEDLGLAVGYRYVSWIASGQSG